MIVRQAKEVARQWVREQADNIPDFYGAFYHGSINWLADDSVVPPTSDVDVMVVLDRPDLPLKPGKFLYRDVLLEISYLPRNRLLSPEQILSDYHLAGSFRNPGLILDPSGELARLQAAVSRDYAKRVWVRRRCEHAGDLIRNRLDALNESVSAPFHDQVSIWLFATGVTTHLLLVAGLKNPTVRRRYLAARELLEDYGRLDFYEELLELLGGVWMGRAQVEAHLPALAAAFDAAGTVIQTPYPFAADLSALARPVAIDGSRELIEGGTPREALFWMVATYSRCLWVLSHDAPAERQTQFSQGYRLLLRDLGITSFADLQQRGEQVRAFLPRLWEVAEAILAANPEIE